MVAPIGGSEISLYHVARGLAALGHRVTVLNHCGGDGGVVDGVRYLDVDREGRSWLASARTDPPDVLVLFRRMLDVSVRVPAPVRLFWAHDYQGVSTVAPPSVGRWLSIGWRRATGPLFHRRLTAVVVPSHFLAGVFHWLFGLPADKAIVLPNGIDPADFEPNVTRKPPARFIHTSVPNRGLSHLVSEIFPAIRRVLPDAELHLFSYDSLAPYAAGARPGVYVQGSVSRQVLARELAQSTLMLYPATVEEAGAIAVLEAMAAGTPAVTSRLGVLPELAGRDSDGRGVLVPGVPGTGAFADAFVRATLDLLRDQARLEAMRTAARRYVLAHHTWDVIVSRWDATLRSLIERQAWRRGPVQPIA